MPTTIASLLELDLLRMADAEVLAGRGQLQRQVRWVHISEQPDIARYLKGGELLLTTGMGLGQNEALQARYVRELAEAHIAGLLIRLGGTWKTAPRRLVSEAERRDLPVIVLHHRIGFIELTEQIHAAIINRQFELLTKAETIGRNFTDLVMRGGDLARIIDELARIVQNPVVLEDPAHQLVAFAARDEATDEVLALWKDRARTWTTDAEGVTEDPVGESPVGVWADVWIGDERWGRLHVLALHKRLDEIDRLALDRASAAVALTLLNQSERDRLTDRACETLIADILGDRYGGERGFFRRADTCRTDFKGHTLVALVLVSQGLADVVASEEVTGADPRRVSRRLLRETQRAISSREAVALSALDGDQVLSIVGLPPTLDPHGAADAIAKALCDRVTELLDGVVPVVGVSGQATPRSLRRAFDQAHEAAEYGRGSRAARVVHFGDLGLQHLLLRLSEGPELARFVEEQLGALLEHDTNRRNPLIPTLRVYLDGGGQKSRAAATLSIQRRSLYHRLDRIAAVLGVDLEDAETQLRLRVALRGLDLLRRRAPVGMSRQLLVSRGDEPPRAGRRAT